MNNLTENILKNQIQNIIELINIENNNEIKQNLINQKESLIKKLKELHKNDGYFKNDKKLEISNQIKHNNIEIYQLKQKIKQEYIEKECNLHIKYPYFIFLSNEIDQKCPYYELNEMTLENRKNWINENEKNGQIYINLYENLIEKKEITNIINMKKECEINIENIIKSILNEKDFELFKEINNNIMKYKTEKVKTKRIKEQYNIIINNLSLLVKKYDIKLNEYMIILHDIYIPVNNVIDKYDKNKNINFENELNNYKNLKDDYNIKTNYISKTINNLHTNLEEFLYEKYISEKKFNQEGKYFKKWNDLLKEEKLERIKSYITYFIINNFVNKNIFSQNEQENEINKLYELVLNNYDNIKNKYIKWNVSSGIINNILCIKYNEKKKEIYLIKELENKSLIKQRISSPRTLFSIDIEKQINEIVMMYFLILKKNNKLKIEKLDKYKEELNEQIKNKLNIKKINLKDKQELNKIYEKTFNIIYHNEY